MNRLEVKVSKLPFVLSILLGLFFVPMGVGMLVSGVSKGNIVPLSLGFMLLVLFAVVLLLVRRGLVRSVKYFSEEGLVRNDGRTFSWAELLRVEDQVRVGSAGRKTIWRTEVQFKNGDSAWLIPSKVANYGEVCNYVNKLPCEHVEKIVGSTPH
jgi:hypothetical protein